MKIFSIFLAVFLTCSLPIPASVTHGNGPLDRFSQTSGKRKKGKRHKHAKKIKPAHWGKPKHR